MDGFVPARVGDVVLARVPREVTTFIRGWGGMGSGSDPGSDRVLWTFTVVIVVVLIFVLKALGLTITIPGSSPDGEEDSSEVKLPEGISKLNDYVYKLYSPPEGKIEMDIIFFHGLQLRDFRNAFWKTWLARKDESVIWPRDWLPKKYPKARIFSVSYDSSAQQSEGQLDMYALGENLVSDIIMSEDLDIGIVRPVFFVGHSLGGLVIKQLIISAFQKQTTMKPRDSSRVEAFLANFRGVFYYATPHQGSRIADLASRLPFTSPILGLLKTLDTHRTRINEEFRLYRSNLGAGTVHMFCVQKSSC